MTRENGLSKIDLNEDLDKEEIDVPYYTQASWARLPTQLKPYVTWTGIITIFLALCLLITLFFDLRVQLIRALPVFEPIILSLYIFLLVFFGISGLLYFHYSLKGIREYLDRGRRKLRSLIILYFLFFTFFGLSFNEFIAPFLLANFFQNYLFYMIAMATVPAIFFFLGIFILTARYAELEQRRMNEKMELANDCYRYLFRKINGASIDRIVNDFSMLNKQDFELNEKKFVEFITTIQLFVYLKNDIELFEQKTKRRLLAFISKNPILVILYSIASLALPSIVYPSIRLVYFLITGF